MSDCFEKLAADTDPYTFILSLRNNHSRERCSYEATEISPARATNVIAYSHLHIQPPEESLSWEGVYQATEIGPACYQNLITSIRISHPGWDWYDEDCLHLNIVTPEVSSHTGVVTLFYHTTITP